jgi:aspartyl-tRNA(Asn)/glutamyl-tRNA(Gln) amidotransferase subunit B
LAIHNEPKKIANYIANDLLRELSAAEGEGAMPLEESLITPRLIAGLAKLVDNGGISSQIAKDVFVEMFKTGKPAEQIVEEKGLKQSSDAGELEGICQQVIDDNPKPAKQFQEGKEGAINALKGQVMKATRGQANPRMVDEILRRLLGK